MHMWFFNSGLRGRLFMVALSQLSSVYTVSRQIVNKEMTIYRECLVANYRIVMLALS